MGFLKFVVKILIILAMVLLIAIPFLAEFLTFKRDKKKKISYKRFRILVFTVIYIIAITIALYLLKNLIAWLGSLSVVQWIASKVALSSRTLYFSKVFSVILINFAVGGLFGILSKLVRIGLQKKDLLVPKKQNGEFSWQQKIERKIVVFFHTETWFFVGQILKYLSAILSAAYALIFVFYLFPALFDASWIPYDFISVLFSSGYIYPTITLLGLWEAYFFLEGIKHLEDECPELLQASKSNVQSKTVDLDAIDKAVREQFGDYYACDLKFSESAKKKKQATSHHQLTEYIAQSVERDKRNPQSRKEVYLDCVDKLVESEKGLLINGNFFSEFSMYFLRYLSAIIARGDNVVLVCNTDAQIDSVYEYLTRGLAEISSLYCQGFQTDGVDFDDPIWRVIKVSGEHSAIDDAAIDDNNILITSLGYLCSSRFEDKYSKFISLVKTVIFVDVLVTINTFKRQMSILNTRLKHLTVMNSLAAKNGKASDMFRMRYRSRQVRYICFDDTRTPGLDKILKNMLSVDFDSADAMNYNAKTIVRCYNFEGKVDENGRRKCPQFIDSDEEIGSVVNMAVLCCLQGASNVSVFVDDALPYADIAESIAANRGKISVNADNNSIRFNKPFYNPDAYSVIVAFDSNDDLPAAIRRYTSMLSDKPVLLFVISRPYMLRDYYVENIDKIWSSGQIERVPVEEGTKKDVAQRILIKANAGGISKTETMRLASRIPQFTDYVQRDDLDAVLRGILQEYGVSQEDRIDLFKYFEYISSQDFDETGKFSSDIRIVLRRKGKLFESINGRDMVVMIAGDSEVTLPIPRNRLTQNFIAGQNLVHNGNIYHIQKIDTASGRIYARLAVGGKNVEAYLYVQVRKYRLDILPELIEYIFPSKHVLLNRSDESICVNDVYLSVFRAPMEVLTDGYFEVDPHSLTVDPDSEYHSISDFADDDLAKQTYRRYGRVTKPAFSSDSIMKSTNLTANEQGALVMSLRICGQFGPDMNRTMLLASVMLAQILRSMFPSVADSIAVCPVLHGELPDDGSQLILRMQPQATLIGENERISAGDFELLIIEDCATDLGVVSVLMSAGDDVLNTLFEPVFRYLEWYSRSAQKSNYLYFGLDHEPACFDFVSLHKLAKLLGDDKHDLKFVDMESLVEYEVCDFCGKRYAKNGAVVVLSDGRKMCGTCARDLVDDNRKVLKSYLEHAKIFLESTYGITLGDEYEFCFETTEKIANTLRQGRGLIRRGADIPLRSYVDEKKKIHVETSIPAVNFSEILVRELTHAWQLQRLPDLDESIAEGHIALVTVQYLTFLSQDILAASRTTYYESTSNLSGEGYRKLVRELLSHPQFNNDPFRYLLACFGLAVEDSSATQPSGSIGAGDLGLPYTAAAPDRALDGNITYFYYSRLSDTCRKVYDLMLAAIADHAEKVVVDDCSFEDVNKVANAIIYDHPELFWYKNFFMSGTEITLSYGASSEEVAVLQRRIDDVVSKYLEGIDDTMSAYDVALRIHAKIVAAVDYDTIALNKQQQEGGPAKDRIDFLRTICGVFLEEKAVCEGYARGVQYLLQKCGIECAEVAGYICKETGEKDGAHAWDLLKVDGEYYYMDTTWDDSSNTVQTVKKTDLGFDYFCITTEELLRTRDLELCPTEMPNCCAINANYYYHNNLVLDSYDLNKITSIAQAAARAGNKAFRFKCKDSAVFNKALDRMCVVGKDCYDVLKAAAKVDKKILGTAYRYSSNKKIWSITIYFKYK